MSNPLVSIIMIVKNGERFVEQAIRSIISQDYQPYEILVIDGQSKDRTREIVKSFSKVQVVLQNGSGISDAYNQGIKIARGEYIAFLSHDDIWTSNKLRIQMSFMQDHSNLQFTNCHVKYFLEPGSGIPRGFRKEWLTGTHPAWIMETLVARRGVFDRVGFFNTSLPTAEDVDWYSRASDMKTPSYMLPQVLLHKRIHGTNASMDVDSNNQNLLSVLREAVKRKKTLQ